MDTHHPQAGLGDLGPEPGTLISMGTPVAPLVGKLEVSDASISGTFQYDGQLHARKLFMHKIITVSV